MPDYAIIQNNKVVNIQSVGEANWTARPPKLAIKIRAAEKCIIGATYVAGGTPRFVNPAAQQTWTAYQFLNRFTDSELLDIRSRVDSDPIMWKFLTFATAAQEVVNDDPVTVQGMAYLTINGVLTDNRRQEILGLI